jgi:hypothetical protein
VGSSAPVFSAFFGCFLFFAFSARARRCSLRRSTAAFIRWIVARLNITTLTSDSFLEIVKSDWHHAPRTKNSAPTTWGFFQRRRDPDLIIDERVFRNRDVVPGDHHDDDPAPDFIPVGAEKTGQCWLGRATRRLEVVEHGLKHVAEVPGYVNESGIVYPLDPALACVGQDVPVDD